jgi:hypothetical protein
MSARVAVVFGQFGQIADPINLPHFEQRLKDAGLETILVQHTDTQLVYNFLHAYTGNVGVVGASLGAGVAPIMAGYLKPKLVQFVGGFQPSDWDPVMHEVNLRSGDDVITKAVTVPSNCVHALCFRNPVVAATGGLGHATYVLGAGNTTTKLQIVERLDVHPGDFGVAQDTMLNTALEVLK